MQKVILTLTALALLGFTGPSLATHCNVAAVKAVAVHQPVYQQAAVATYYQPVYYPVYSIGYTPSNGESLKEELLKLKIEFQSLQIQQLKQQLVAPQVTPEPQKAGMIGIFSAKCSKCHNDTTAKDSGGGFVLLKNGKIDHLTAADKLQIISRLITSDPQKLMPKGGKGLPDEELASVVQELTSK